MKATAEAEAQRLRGQADAEADGIRNEAPGQATPQVFTRSSRNLRNISDPWATTKTLLLLSTQRELFDRLAQSAQEQEPTGGGRQSTPRRHFDKGPTPRGSSKCRRPTGPLTPRARVNPSREGP